MNAQQHLYKRNLLWIMAITFSLLSLYAILVYIIDPLQQFRLAKYHPSYINEVYQNAGLAKHVAYNTIIVGSSLMENFRPSSVEKTLGLPAVKLSISGTNAYEESIVLDSAIATGKVKNVILGLDIFRLAIDQKREHFPAYLYSHNSLLGTMKYLLNIGNIDFMLNTLATHFIKNKLPKLDDAFVEDDKTVYGEEHVMRDFYNAINHPENDEYPLTKMQQNFDKTILSIIKSHPAITFYLFFHPYSIYTYKMYDKQGNLLKFLQMKKYIFSQTKNLANVKLYDFEEDLGLTTNLAHYKDIGHYSADISNYIIKELAGESYRVNEKNIDKLMHMLASQASNA